MRPITQQKSIKKNYINLQPVEIDVQLTQKSHALGHQFQHHTRSNLDIKVAQTYDNILNSIIEDLLVALSESREPGLEALTQLISIKKQKISFIAVLNLQFVPKLTYILDKCQQCKIDIDLEFIRSQINYWTSFIQYSLIEKSQQIEKYGPINKKQNNYSQIINRDHHRILQQDVQQLNSESDYNEQKQPIKISKAPRRRQRIEQTFGDSIKPSKIPRNRYSSNGNDMNKNGDIMGGNENYFGNIDS